MILDRFFVKYLSSFDQNTAKSSGQDPPTNTTASSVRLYPCTFFNVSLFIFLNEIQGKAFVIHLSFEDRNRFYIDFFSKVNVRHLYLSWPARS